MKLRDSCCADPPATLNLMYRCVLDPRPVLDPHSAPAVEAVFDLIRPPRTAAEAEAAPVLARVRLWALLGPAELVTPSPFAASACVAFCR